MNHLQNIFAQMESQEKAKIILPILSKKKKSLNWMHILKYFIFFLFTIARRSFAFCISLLFFFTCLLTGSSVNQDALVGPQVAEVEQHHVGGDVVDGEGGRLLEAHALWDEEGVAHRRHHHLLPQPEAAQHHHLVADLPGGRETQSEPRRKTKSQETQRSCFSFFFPLSFFWFRRRLPGNTRPPLSS